MRIALSRRLLSSCLHALVGLVLALAAGSVRAQDGNADAVGEVTRRWLDTSLRNASTVEGTALRMEVVVGALDSRLRLAPCQRIEPYLPLNTRLWGKTRIGLRCLEGSAKWNVFLPVTVKAWGPAWVLNTNVNPGASLRESDAVQTEVDWAADNSPIVVQTSQWVGQAVAYPLAAGLPLRQAMIRPAQAFAAGATVRLVAQGPGFQIATQGQALSVGVIGQPMKVKTDNGNVVTGTVMDTHTVVANL